MCLVETLQPRFHLYLAKSLLHQSNLQNNPKLRNEARLVLINMDSKRASIKQKLQRLEMLVKMRDYTAVTRLIQSPEYKNLTNYYSNADPVERMFKGEMSSDTSYSPRFDVAIPGML